MLNLKVLIYGWTYREYHCVEVSQGGHSYGRLVVGVMLTVLHEVMKGVTAMGAWG